MNPELCSELYIKQCSCIYYNKLIIIFFNTNEIIL